MSGMCWFWRCIWLWMKFLEECQWFLVKTPRRSTDATAYMDALFPWVSIVPRKVPSSDQSSAKEYATEAGGQSKWEHGSKMEFNAALNLVMFSTPIQFASQVIVDQMILHTGESNTPSNHHHSTHEIAMLGSCPIFGHAHDIIQYDPFCLMPCLFGIH